MKAIVTTVLLTLLASVCVGKDSDYTVEQAKDDEIREKALDVNAWLNRLTYAYYVATSSHNKLVVSNELNELRFDMYDYPHLVNCIANDGKQLKTSIDNVRRCLSKQMGADRRFDHFMELVEDRRRRAWKDLWLNILTCGMRSLGSAGKVVAQQAGRGDSVTISANACMTLAGDLLGGPVNAIVDYDRELDRCGEEVKKAQFKLLEEKKSAAETMQGEMFNLAVSFARDMNVEIITLDQIEELFSDVREKSDVLNELLVILDTDTRRDIFKMYAPYWCFLAETASRCGKWDVSLDAATNFFQVYRGVVKKNSLVSTTAKAGVTALVELGRTDDERISKWLNMISQYNDADKIPDDSYFVADCLYFCLKDADLAIRKLDASEIRIKNDMNGAIAKYLEAHNKFWGRRIAFKDDDFNVAYMHYQDLFRVHTLHLDVLKEERNTEALTKYLLRIVDDMAVSPTEKLLYLHRYKDVEGLDVEGLWSEAKKDVAALDMRYTTSGSNRFEARMPVSWLFVGDVKARMELYEDGGKTATIPEAEEYRQIRLATKKDAGFGFCTNTVTLVFRNPTNELKRVDSVKLVLENDENGKLPIEITFKPSVGFDFQARRYEGALKAVEIRIQKSKLNFAKALEIDSEALKEQICRDVRKKNHLCYFMPFRPGSTQHGTNFLDTVFIDSANGLSVACTNPTPRNAKVSISVCYYDHCGARLYKLDKKVNVRPGGGGRKLILIFRPTRRRIPKRPRMCYCSIVIMACGDAGAASADKLLLINRKLAEK